MVTQWKFCLIQFYIYLWRVTFLFSAPFTFIFTSVTSLLLVLVGVPSLPSSGYVCVSCVSMCLCVNKFLKIYGFRFRDFVAVVTSLGTFINTGGQQMPRVICLSSLLKQEKVLVGVPASRQVRRRSGCGALSGGQADFHLSPCPVVSCVLW